MKGETPLLEVRGLRKEFSGRGGSRLRAVDGADLAVRQGETLGLVGESGSGKTTLGRLMLGLETPTAGEVRYDGRDLATLSRREMQVVRREMQVVLQDPYASLDPRMRVGDIVAEPLIAHGMLRRGRRGAAERRRRVGELLEAVGLSPRDLDRYPHEFSGGQRQRIGIARALALRPRLVICDEPVSALDVSIQAQILNLLADLQREFGLAYVFVAHDLSVVRHVAERIAVMYLGRVVELAPTERLFTAARHPYTRSLLSAVPIPDPPRERRRRRVVLSGELPSPSDPPSGCTFRTRCPLAQDDCREIVPPLEPKDDPQQLAACHHPVRSLEDMRPEPPGRAVELPHAGA